jgi:hypothetical protein
MTPRAPAASVVRLTLTALAFGVVIYLAALAWRPHIRDSLPLWLNWFGRPGSIWTITLTVLLLAAVCVLTYRAHGAHRRGTIPIGVIVVLTAVGAVLGYSSWASCEDSNHPAFFTALMWTASVVKGGIDDHQINSQLCPPVTPVALAVARITGLSAVFLGLASIAFALLQNQVDRFKIRIARSITAVVDVDDDVRPMISAITATLERRSRLALIVSNATLPALTDLRMPRVSLVGVDLDRPETLRNLRLWSKLDKLYLLSADPSANLIRLSTINDQLPKVLKRERLPLIVRIDDPWQAESWRAQQMGGSDTRWVADAVGKYEVTTTRLIDRILAGGRVRKIIVCGSSPLTLAVCANVARREFERSYHSEPGAAPLPTVTLVGEAAEEYRLDHDFHQQQLGLPASTGWLDAVVAAPSVSALIPLIAGSDDSGVPSVAVIVVDDLGSASVDATLGTRLAARFPWLPILAWDPNARELRDVPAIVGQLQTFRLALDTPSGQAQDGWERAARLIHQHYVAQFDPPAQDAQVSESAKPWAELNEFYRESNRRQLRNALWMVEKVAGHTWDTFVGYSGPPPSTDDDTRSPLKRLQRIGFEPEAAYAMAKAEHEDWYRYYHDAGWRYGPVRVEGKFHERMLTWEAVQSDPAALQRALESVAQTLYALRELGYRSRPVWQTYRRSGTVTAEQRSAPWTWRSNSGDTMRADAGDWAVTDSDTERWSVRDDIFRSTYEHVGGDVWRRTGSVRARPARDGETIATLEGPVLAVAGDWILKGAAGEQWPVSAERFSKLYEGPISVGVDGSDDARASTNVTPERAADLE